MIFIFLFNQLFFNLIHASIPVYASINQNKGDTYNLEFLNDCHKKKQSIQKKIHKTLTVQLITKTKKTSRNIKLAPPKKSEKGLNRLQCQDGTTAIQNSKDPAILEWSLINKRRYLHAKQAVIKKLLAQIGKPYCWGGSQPNTGFDCSGLIYYAYKDEVKIKMPRTAQEMYYSPYAQRIKKCNLERGDLVFFQIHNPKSADHVGVYLGDGEFIQSPRSGKDIRISQLENNYWKYHYIGARRLVTLATIR